MSGTDQPESAVPDAGRQEQPDRWEKVSLASARVPFRLKVAVVWVSIFGVLAGLFAIVGFDTAWMKDNFSFIAGGLKYKLYMAVGGIVLAVILAGIGALGRISSNPIAYGISGFYVSFFRGTPLLVQITLIYSALPQIGDNLVVQHGAPVELKTYLTLNVVTAGILALGLNYGAYMTEIFRAGIQSVSGGQAEAADALGMTYRQKMRKVILPQAFRVIIPPTGNEFIAMMKDTALVSFLGVALNQAEIFRRASYLGTTEFKSLEALVVAASLYWGLTIVFTFFQRRLETRLSRGYVRTGAIRVTVQGH
jgi:polar amino acid transport system permease protein